MQKNIKLNNFTYVSEKTCSTFHVNSDKSEDPLLKMVMNFDDDDDENSLIELKKAQHDLQNDISSIGDSIE